MVCSKPIVHIRLFRKIITPEQQKQICRYVDGQKGCKVVCGGVSCIFEFEVYKFCGHDLVNDDPDSAKVATSDSTPGCDGENIKSAREGTGFVPWLLT